MEEIMMNLFQSLKQEIGFWKALFILGILLIPFLLRKKIFEWLSSLAHELLEREIFRFNKAGIVKHPIFSKLKYLQNQRLKFLKCQCPLRKNIFSDLMIIRVKAMEFILTDFLDSNDLNKYNDADFQFKLSSILYDLYMKWEEDAKQAGIPQIIISKFVNSVTDIREGLISYVQTSSNSYSNFKNNYAKMYAMLDILSGFEELVIIRMELELDEMNGEISKSEYKGHRCEHCTICQSKKIQREMELKTPKDASNKKSN